MTRCRGEQMPGEENRRESLIPLIAATAFSSPTSRRAPSSFFCYHLSLSLSPHSHLFSSSIPPSFDFQKKKKLNTFQRHQPRRTDHGALDRPQRPRVLPEVPAKGRLQGLQLVQQRRVRRRRPARELRPEDVERLVREETERDSLFEALGFFKGEGKGEKGVEVERRKKSPTLKNSFPKQKQKTSKPGTSPSPGAARDRSRCGSPGSPTETSPRRRPSAARPPPSPPRPRSSATAPGASARTGPGGS